MKKYFAILMMMLVGATTTFAEEGDKWAGINLNYGVHSKFKNFGIGGKFQYEIKPNLRLEAAANYFFKKKVSEEYGDYNASQWDVNVNAQYLIHIADRMNVYPIIGPSIMTYKVGDNIVGTGYHTRFGVNIGAGWEYEVNDEIKLNFDFKYQYLKDIDRPVFAIAASYKL